MIKSVIATNYLGESLTMGIGDPDESGLLISSIDGIGPGESEINITELAATDGAVYNSSRIPSRNIVLSLIFQGNPTIEDSRYLTYKMFPLKKPINLMVITDRRALQIDGYVESNDPSIFEQQEGTSISIICPSYYFYSLMETSVEFGGTKKLFEFPFSNDITDKISETNVIGTIDDDDFNPILDYLSRPINGELIFDPNDRKLEFGEILRYGQHTIFYEGDAETGVVINVHFLGSVGKTISFENTDTGEIMRINTSKISSIIGSDVQRMDDLVISTIRGNKSITLVRNGTPYNVLNCLERDSDWLTLDVGRNELLFAADTNTKNLVFNIEYYPLFEGV